MRVLITGSRDWVNESRMRAVFVELDKRARKPITLVHGCARGADRMAGKIAEELGWVVEEHPADWDTYGKRAGLLRNEEMVTRGADLCLAFPMPSSRGTYHCMRLARLAEIEVRTVPWI